MCFEPPSNTTTDAIIQAYVTPFISGDNFSEEDWMDEAWVELVEDTHRRFGT